MTKFMKEELKDTFSSMWHGFLIGIAILFFFSVTPCNGQTLEEAQALVNEGAYEEAAEVLRPLAEAGDAHAQNNLGVLYENGLGLAQDTPAALYYYGEAMKGSNQAVAKQAERNRKSLIFRTNRNKM